MINSKRKGGVIELEVVNFLKNYGLDAERTVQYCGNTGEASDIRIKDDHFLANWHIEVKGTKHAKLLPSQLNRWLNQVENDCNGRRWIIFHRPNNHELGVIYKPFRPYWEYPTGIKLYHNIYELPTRDPVIELKRMSEADKLRYSYKSSFGELPDNDLLESLSYKELPILFFIKEIPVFYQNACDFMQTIESDYERDE